jgi:hypothetical protein
MNEADARRVTLMQAYETAQPPTSAWGEDDRAWADRVALEAAGAQLSADEFLAVRARHALQRLASREPAAERWLTQPLWRWRWILLTTVFAFMVGLLADSIGPAQRINLLAPPLWGVLLWNAVVYLGLLGTALAGILRRGPRAPGPVVRTMQALLRAGRRLPRGGASAAAWRIFAGLWSARTAGVSVLRAETALHAGAAALALGLIAGLYARGLALDYRAVWESTFLTPAVAHGLVTGVLAPAAQLTGIALPDAAGFAALQTAHGAANAGAPAAAWIHLLALSLLLYVVLPRTLLALVDAARARARESRFELALTDPYYQRLLRLQRGGSAQVEVWPYAITPSPQAVLALRTLLVDALGARVGLRFAPPVAHGGEDELAVAPAAAGLSHAIAWFDLSATPEVENHVRFVRHLAAALPGTGVLVLIDEAAFKRRFAAAPERLAQRRDAWRQCCESLGTLPVFADLEAPDAAVVGPALQAALARPVSPVAAAAAGSPA